MPSSDMANIDLGWDVEGQMTAEESVSAMLKVIPSKGYRESGTFWTWENKVGLSKLQFEYATNRLSKAISMVVWKERAALLDVTQQPRRAGGDHHERSSKIH